MPSAISIPDFRALAQRRLPRFLFEYVDGGAFSETTLKQNERDLSTISVRQRVLQDVAAINLSTRLFGRHIALPLALAPVGLAGLNARRGEVQAQRAADAVNIPFCLSTVSACSLDDVAACASDNLWFQLYMMKDRGFVSALLAQAGRAGCKTLIFTVDMPVPGVRYRDYRSGLAGSPGMGGALRRIGQAMLRPGWAWDVGLRGRPHHLGNVAPLLAGKTGIEDFFAWMRANFDPSVTWRDLEFIRANWAGSLVIKGILDERDARACVELGADGIVVSNHGGRQLDGAASTARVLPEIADAVRGQITVMADGGVRSGLDILRMLALGADAVMLGRPWVYALAAGGEAGVRQMLAVIERELRVAMALAGVTSIAAIDRSILHD